MKRIIAVTINTYREAIRNKILYTVLFFLFILLGISTILGSFTMGETQRFVINFGLAGTELLGVTMAIIIGTGMIYNEIQRRTIYTVLSKPIKRWQYILGKFLGLGLTLFIQEFLMILIVAIFLVLVKGKLTLLFFIGAFYLYMTILLTIALSIFFSTFTSPILSGLFTATFYIIGESLEELRVLLTTKLAHTSFAKLIVQITYDILPNFGNLNIKNEVVHNVALPQGYIINSSLYAIAYVLFLLTISTLIFERKQFY